MLSTIAELTDKHLFPICFQIFIVFPACAYDVGGEAWNARPLTIFSLHAMSLPAERLEGIMKRMEALNEKVAELASKDQVQIC
jgi:hypothetical protein